MRLYYYKRHYNLIDVKKGFVNFWIKNVPFTLCYDSWVKINYWNMRCINTFFFHKPHWDGSPILETGSGRPQPSRCYEARQFCLSRSYKIGGMLLLHNATFDLKGNAAFTQPQCFCTVLRSPRESAMIKVFVYTPVAIHTKNTLTYNCCVSFCIWIESLTLESSSSIPCMESSSRSRIKF